MTQEFAENRGRGIMERLTKKYSNGIITLDAAPYNMAQEVVDVTIRNCEPIAAMVRKLAAYEDAEEQGLLVKLPFKPGDVVWAVKNDVYEDEPNVEGYTFMAECRGYAILTIEYAHCVDFKQQMAEMAEDAIYENFAEMIIVPMENIFHTREEAEQALKEVE